jgi:hypothetical protein
MAGRPTLPAGSYGKISTERFGAGYRARSPVSQPGWRDLTAALSALRWRVRVPQGPVRSNSGRAPTDPALAT